MADSSSGSYCSLWSKIVASELRKAKSIELIGDTTTSSSKLSLTEYFQWIDQYCMNHATQSLTNILPLIGEFKDELVEIKSNKRADKYRTIGNSYFKLRRYDTALSAYRKSLLHSACQSEGEALAYGNLSATYFLLGDYTSCIEAIRRALLGAFPQSKVEKLTARLISCAEKLNVSITPQLQASSDNYCRENILKVIANILNVCPQNSDVAPHVTPKYGYNQSIPHFSSGVVMERNDEEGRFIISNADFEPGDVVLVEDPYAWISLRPFRQDFCYGCLNELRVPVACPTCTEALFCSDQCCKKSWLQSHSFECRFMFFFNCIGVGHLCAKIILICGQEQFFNSLKSDDNLISDVKGDGYEAVYKLVDNWSQFPREEQFEYGLTAWLICQLLKAMDFLPISKASLNVTDISEINLDKDSSENSVLWNRCGARCLLHLLQLQLNAHAITMVTEEIDLDQPPEALRPDIASLTQCRLATAIFPSASLLNHACRPTVVNAFQGTQLVLRSTKVVVNGDQLFNCYGPHALRLSAVDRQTALASQYFFKCKCVDCASGDVEIEKLGVRSFKCRCGGRLDDNLTCVVCSKSGNRTTLEKLAEEANNLYRIIEEDTSDGEILLALEQSHSIRERILYRDNTELCRTKDLLAEHYILHSDDEKRVKAVSLAEECLESTRRVWGSQSLEVAWQLIHVARLYTAFKTIIDSTKQASISDLWTEIRAILTINYGCWLANKIVQKEIT